MKNQIKLAAVSTVKFIAAPAHIVLSVSANLVAEAEGRVIQAIDGTPKAETIEKRFDYTNEKMLMAAMKADEIRTKLQAKLDSIKKPVEEDPTDIVVHATVMPE